MLKLFKEKEFTEGELFFYLEKDVIQIKDELIQKAKNKDGEALYTIGQENMEDTSQLQQSSDSSETRLESNDRAVNSDSPQEQSPLTNQNEETKALDMEDRLKKLEEAFQMKLNAIEQDKAEKESIQQQKLLALEQVEIANNALQERLDRLEQEKTKREEEQMKKEEEIKQLKEALAQQKAVSDDNANNDLNYDSSINDSENENDEDDTNDGYDTELDSTNKADDCENDINYDSSNDEDNCENDINYDSSVNDDDGENDINYDSSDDEDRSKDLSYN